MASNGILTRVSAVAFVAAAGLMSTTALAQADWLDDLEPRTLKLADFSGDQTANFGKAMVTWEEAITDFTDGKITFENYWSSSLLGALDTLDGVGDGVADIGLIIPSYMPQKLPVASWMFGMGADLSGSTVHDVAAGGAAALETLLTYQPVIDEYARHTVILQATATPAYNLLCNTPIASLNDAQGKRARAIGAVWSTTVEALGMTPLSIAWGESYEGLQRGVFDCMVINPNQYADGLVLKDVAPEYVPVTLAQLQASTWVMNKDVWDSFPVELQNFIIEQNVKAAYDIWAGYLEIEAKAGDLIAAGEEIHTNDISALEPVAAEQRAAFIAALPDSAPGQVENPQDFVTAYKDRIDYWTKVLEDQGYTVAERTPEAIMEAFAGLRDVDLSDFYAKFDAEVTPGLKK